MIFYCDLQGNLKAFQNETVYQGSNNVTTIYVVAPFSRPVGLNISFTKPNKLVTSPAIMKWVGTLGNVKIPVSFVNIPEQFTETYNVWAYALPYSITEQNGVVGVSVNAVIADSVDASGQQAYAGNLTTFTGQFTVAYSALPSPPTDIPTEWTQDKVLDLLNNYYNDAIQKIGEMNTLKTDAKDTLVKAINEVFDEIASTNATIGDLSTLTTDEKTTIVGAINEVDNHADTAQQTADNATTLANTGISKAEQAQATANGAVATANEAKTTAQTAETNANSALDTANAANTTADEAKAIAQGSQRAIGFATLKAAITALNGYSNTQLKVGDNVYIVETGVPDLWVAAVEQNSVAYNYTTNDAFNDDLVENTLVQVGYYKFAYLESDGKPCTVAWQNMTVEASDWVASTEFEDFAYEAKIALTDFVNFSSIPQVVFGLTEATSGNYAPICKAGDKGVYIYSKVNTAITLPTVVTFAPNVHGASMQGGGYNNRGKWVASTTYAIDDLVYTDNGQYVCIEGITSTTSPEQDTTHWQATFVATGTIPEALPATGAKITGNLPTSGWASDTPSWIGQNALTWTEKNEGSYYVQGGTEDLGLSSSGSYSAVVTIDGTDYSADVEGILPSDGTFVIYAGYFNNNNIELNIIDHCVGFDGNGEAIAGNGYLVMVIYMRGTVPSSVIVKSFSAVGGISAIISNSAIKVNSAVTMYIDYNGKIKAEEKTNGSITVSADETPTEDIPYTLQVVETSAEGAFEIVNSYLPTIPETPTALPQEAGALKSGNLPTSGWAQGDIKWYWEQEQDVHSSGSNYVFFTKNTAIADRCWNENATTIAYKSNYNDNTVYTQSYDSSQSTEDYRLYGEYPNYQSFRIYKNGDIYARTGDNASINIYARAIGFPDVFEQLYTISDTSITANSDILMELTDDGGVKSQALANGSITVIRDTVPTQPIPYTYKVKQTNASGQFTLVNHFVPEIPEVPTTTTLYEDSTGAATVTLSETINNGDIVRIKTNNGNVDHYYIGVAWNRAITVTESFMVTDESDVTVGTAINIDSLRFNIQDTSLILFHYFKTNITTAGAVTISNEKANVVIRKVERIHA